MSAALDTARGDMRDGGREWPVIAQNGTYTASELPGDISRGPSLVPPGGHPDAAPSFGAQLRAHRERAGLTHRALAARIGKRDGRYVARWERGVYIPSWEHAAALATALGLADGERAEFLAAVVPRPVAVVRRLPSGTIGVLVARYRRRLGVSQSELGRLSGLLPNTLNRIESGERGVSAPMLMALATGLRLSPGERDVLLLAAGLAPVALADAVALPLVRRIVRLLGNLDGECRDQCAADLAAVCRRWTAAPRHRDLLTDDGDGAGRERR